LGFSIVNQSEDWHDALDHATKPKAIKSVAKINWHQGHGGLYPQIESLPSPTSKSSQRHPMTEVGFCFFAALPLPGVERS
jgi:hypothetical protein